MRPAAHARPSAREVPYSLRSTMSASASRLAARQQVPGAGKQSSRRSVLCLAGQRKQLPIFPLNVVALPHAVVPLMIFEARWVCVASAMTQQGCGLHGHQACCCCSCGHCLAMSSMHVAVDGSAVVKPQKYSEHAGCAEAAEMQQHFPSLQSVQLLVLHLTPCVLQQVFGSFFALAPLCIVTLLRPFCLQVPCAVQHTLGWLRRRRGRSSAG